MKNIYLLSSVMKSCLVLAAFGLGSLLLVSNSTFANDKVVDIMPAVSAADDEHSSMPEKTTHPLVRLTPDKSELIRLDGKAGSIIIGNPLHINVIADSSSTLVVVPRSPGATHFTVLSKTGEVLMQRHVIVASPKEDYIRIKKTCMEDSEGCQKTNVYYCPDMCHEIGLVQDDEKSSGQSDNKDDKGGSDSKSSDSSDTPADE